MPRKEAFCPERQPLRNHPDLQLQSGQVSGPISFLNPTWAPFKPTVKPKGRQENEHPLQQESKTVGDRDRNHDHDQDNIQVERLWRSRDNRKGRHALQLPYLPDHHEQLKHILPEATSSLGATLHGLRRMITYYPYWDISYWVAIVFTFGSAVWVTNAFFVWLPLEAPLTKFPNESKVGGGVTAFIGTTTFEVGSVLMILEAVNENQTGCFGWAVQTVIKNLESRDNLGTGTTTMTMTSMTEVKPADKEDCNHHHSNRHCFLDDDGGVKGDPAMVRRSFRWLPSLMELRTHYIHELGFLASLIQLVGATVFWISGFTALPGIMNHMSQGLTDGVYWVPQIIGGTCFMISGLLFTIETQPKWYIPAPLLLGWHVGYWNLIGGIGFTLCGALGPASTRSSKVEYQSTLATFWGSWAFLTGSVIQWYESLQKYPVEKMKKKMC